MSGHRRRPPQRFNGGTRAGSDPATGRRAARREQVPRKDVPGRARRRAPQKQRRLDYPRRGRTGPRRWLPSVRQLLALFLLFFGGTAAAVGYAYATVTIPDPNPSTLLQNNVYYWSDGTVLATDGSVNRQNVTLSQVPADVQWDFIAAENASFYTDPGIDPEGIARAVVHMAEGGSVQSGSTITQQFVKNTYLDQSQTVSRKFREL